MMADECASLEYILLTVENIEFTRNHILIIFEQLTLHLLDHFRTQMLVFLVANLKYIFLQLLPFKNSHEYLLVFPEMRRGKSAACITRFRFHYLL